MNLASPFLPYGKQCIDDDDIQCVVDVLKSEWLTCGPAVSKFESDFKEVTRASHAVACSSGTAGLHLAALALNLGSNDAVIVPTTTFLATANAVRYTGAEVVFADVDPHTGLLTANTLQSCLDTNKGMPIKAVFPVHLNGQCVDLASIKSIVESNNLAVVEDACHAIGGTYKGANGKVLRVGDCSLSDMTVFSLHPVKTVTMGEGGVVTTNREDLNSRLRLARNHGMDRDVDSFENREFAFDKTGQPNPWYYEMHQLGFNYRATDIQCALGSSQVKKTKDICRPSQRTR
ncbi:aminotransferase class I/II-fold pyridoxal phosphate-dependent enzyme [Magnetovibrio blakemorei]|uniref:aminotransferase class I/II-fold pyridoxal phosphate-dependent enzyme n=1 Tax=Magnetovibrio blakemorei TaxID=28181 RepID=UPI000A99046D|nr:aminotransferase class I/II-fold pyridoxal phosphate-dependent enzyme [Magnetovibrio blakemorei]